MDTETTKRIDGKQLADDLLDTLKPRIAELKKRKIVPTLSVIQVANDKASKTYIRKKKELAQQIGAQVQIKHFSKNVFFQELAETIHEFNANPTIHGIIIQRPLPLALSTSSFNKAIDLEKDIDGFRPKSLFQPPIAQAIFHIFRHIYQLKNVTTHLKNKQIVIIGRGETAGKPIAELLAEKKIPFIQCHSKTANIEEFTQEADIIISCVGKPNVVTSEIIKEGVVLIGVGIGRGKKGKAQGDYDEDDIAEKASYYTPTPRGIGPLNIAYLLSNLVLAAERSE